MTVAGPPTVYRRVAARLGQPRLAAATTRFFGHQHEPTRTEFWQRQRSGSTTNPPQKPATPEEKR